MSMMNRFLFWKRQEITPIEALAVRAMEIAARTRQASFVYGIYVRSRDLRCPVHCASCHTMYEGSNNVCPACTSAHAVGPVTELSMQIARLRETTPACGRFQNRPRKKGRKRPLLVAAQG